MTAILKQFQATPPPAFVKAVEEIFVTCGGAHPYYQCLAAGGNTFPELRDNIQGYVAAAVVNYNHGNSVYRPLVPIPPSFINPEEDERVEETLTDQNLAEYTIKVPPPLVKKSKPPSQRDFVVHQRGPLHLNIHYPSRMLKQKQQEKDEVQIYKFCELKYKALADLGASINLMPLSDWKKLGLPELISTRMTHELANRAICTLAGIARDVFVLVGKFTFLADFVIVDYESDPKVPLILVRPFLRTARALIDVHREEMILCDGDERLILNMRHDTSSYFNQPQKESINLINVFNDSNEDFLEDLFLTSQPSGIPTFSFHPVLISSKVKNDIFDPEGGNVLPEKLLDLDSTKDLHPPHHVNLLSGSTTSSSPNQLLEEFADKLALITFPLGNDNLRFDIESDLKEIEYMLHHDPIKDIDSILKDSIDQIESDTENVYDDPFDSKGEKIKESKLLIDELDLPCDFLLPSEYDSILSEDFSKVDALPSTNNKDKVFNPGKDYAKIVKNQSKPGNIEHEIGSLHQKPDQRAFFYNNQANEANCQKIESS
nr:reverse transcriptase domain-containing protein [Tanacetum cinerariifolium]